MEWLIVSLLALIIVLVLWTQRQLSAIKRRLTNAGLAFIVVLLPAQEKPKANVWSPNDAYVAAWTDLQQFAPARRRSLRYLSTRDMDGARRANIALNASSRGAVIHPLMPIANGQLIRVDLTYLADDKNLAEYAAVWEELRFDPQFNLLLTPATLKFAAIYGLDPGELPPSKPVLVPSPPWRDPNTGITYNQRWETPPVLVRKVGQHLDPLIVQAMIDATGSAAPVVRYEYHTARAIRQVQRKGIYKTIFGGLYYRFLGIKKAKGPGADEDEFFRDFLGIGDGGKGSAAKVYEKLASDSRVGTFKSNVTHKPRQIEILNTAVGRGVLSIAGVTHDIDDEDIDIDVHPMMNLSPGAFTDKAREVIFLLRNGMIGGVLFNGQGSLVDSVPETVAKDSTDPTGILQPVRGCMACHGKHNGWQPVVNDVLALTTLDGGLDIFNDVVRLRGLYKGDPERKQLPRARDDQAEQLLECLKEPSGLAHWWGPRENLARAAEIGFGQVTDHDTDWWHGGVDAARAGQEMGLQGDLTIKSLYPPAKRGDIYPEDPRLKWILLGHKASRFDFELGYSFYQMRVRR